MQKLCRDVRNDDGAGKANGVTNSVQYMAVLSAEQYEESRRELERRLLADDAQTEDVATTPGRNIPLAAGLLESSPPVQKLAARLRDKTPEGGAAREITMGVKDSPFKFTLTDAMAMMPQLKLSSFPEIVVVARVSKSGNASPQAGDLQGGSGQVKAGEKGVRVTIDAVVP